MQKNFGKAFSILCFQPIQANYVSPEMKEDCFRDIKNLITDLDLNFITDPMRK